MHFPTYRWIIYARFVMFKLTSMAFIVKKKSESTTLSLLRSEKVKDRQMEDNTILWNKQVKEKDTWMCEGKRLVIAMGQRTVEGSPSLQQSQVHSNTIAFTHTKGHEKTFQHSILWMGFIPTIRQKLVRLTDM